MKAIVIVPDHEFYDCMFEVSCLSYDNAAGRDLKTGDIVAAGFEQLKFIFDDAWEKEIIENREILYIKKPRKASYYMYYALVKSIEAHINEELFELIVLDEKDIDSKKVWMKSIKASANNKPLTINITGKNYSNKYDIRITDGDREEFIKECRTEIERLQIGLKRDVKRINGLVDTIKDMKNEKVYTSTLELSLKGA